MNILLVSSHAQIRPGEAAKLTTFTFVPVALTRFHLGPCPGVSEVRPDGICAVGAQGPVWDPKAWHIDEMTLDGDAIDPRKVDHTVGRKIFMRVTNMGEFPACFHAYWECEDITTVARGSWRLLARNIPMSVPMANLHAFVDGVCYPELQARSLVNAIREGLAAHGAGSASLPGVYNALEAFVLEWVDQTKGADMFLTDLARDVAVLVVALEYNSTKNRLPSNS